MLELQNIATDIAGRPLHRGITVRVERGEALGVIGASGAGKTVLLRAILGLHPLLSGTVLYQGKDLTLLPAKEAQTLRSTWGVMFQSGALFSSMTVFDNVAWPLRMQEPTLPERNVAQLVSWYLNAVNLTQDAWSRLPTELSGGMVKRAALARALILEPDILFLDEPTAGLDPVSASHFNQLMVSIRTWRPITLLMITHDLISLARVCSRVAFLHQKSVTVGTLASLKKMQDPEIKDYFMQNAVRPHSH